MRQQTGSCLTEWEVRSRLYKKSNGTQGLFFTQLSFSGSEVIIKLVLMYFALCCSILVVYIMFQAIHIDAHLSTGIPFQIILG